MPRYGEINDAWFASLFEREEPGGPIWALNRMKHREQADYADGRATELSGAETDDIYEPHEHLAAVGSSLFLVDTTQVLL